MKYSRFCHPGKTVVNFMPYLDFSLTAGAISSVSLAAAKANRKLKAHGLPIF